MTTFRTLPSTRHSRAWLWTVVLWLGLSGGSIAVGQNIIQPANPPPGGLTAIPLRTSGAVQRKLGSLIIGEKDNPATICLNTALDPAEPPPATTDPVRCISSWTELATVIASGLVHLKTNLVTGCSLPGNIACYGEDVGTGTGLPQNGYVRLKGNSEYTTTMTTTTDTAAIPLNGSTALRANGLNKDNFAGNIAGTLSIQPYAVGDSKLCLEDAGKCITQWSEANVLGSVLYLPDVTDHWQLKNGTLTAQANPSNIGLTKGLVAGSLIFGDPSVLPTSVTCGDGMCYGTENGSNCALDCAAIGRPSSVTTSVTGLTDAVELTITPSASSVSILVVRSSNKDFIFEPVDGMSYTTGPNNATGDTFAVVAVVVATDTDPLTITDSGKGMVTGRKYYYRVYQGNLFPRFHPTVSSPGYVTAFATPHA